MGLREKLEKSFKEKWLMRFKTVLTGGDAYDGVVTHIGREFFAAREFSSFEMEGLQILANWVIRGTRDGKFERCFNKIIASNGEIQKVGMPEWLTSCETLREVIVQIKESDIWPGIETNFNRKPSAFYLGPVTKVKKSSFYLHCYDAAGKWEDEYKIRFDEIFRIEIDSPYTNHFNAYMRKKELRQSVT